MPKGSSDSGSGSATRTVTVPAPAAGTATSRKGAAATARPGTRSVTVPSPADFELAKDDALLQLKIGRSAHLYTVFVSAALALDGVLLLFFYPHLPALGAHATGLLAVEQTFFLILPLLAGLAISVIGLVSKWETFQLWPWEPHFATSVAAVIGNGVLAVLFALRLAHVPQVAWLPLFPGLYVLELVGISVGLLGIVLTWSGWSGQQWTSALCAVLPIATALLVYFPPSNTTGVSDALAVSLFLSAILYQTSGSFLHLISSGTRPHERELITSGQSKMFRLADEIGQREDAVHYREAALVQREADVENSVLSLRRQTESLTEARRQLDELEGDYRLRSDALIAKERTWAGRDAEMDSRTRMVEDKSKSLELREQEVARALPQLSAREKRLVDQEGEQTKREVDLTARQQEFDRRQASAADSEARLEARKKEIDQKTTDLLRREGELTARSSSGSWGGGVSTAVGQDLASRETKLQQLKAVLDEQNVTLGRRSRELSEMAKSLDASQKRAAAKEVELASRSAGVRQRETELNDLVKSANDRRAQYESASRDYGQRLEEYGRQSVAAAQKGADLDRSLKGIAGREASLADREGRLRSERAEIERRENELTARERAVQATEAELSLRRQASLRGGDLSFAGLAAVAAAEGMDQPVPPGDRRAAGRGRVAVRDLADSPVANPVDVTPVLSTPQSRRRPDRLPTGTPRLDDLLLGGFPPRGHVALVGDAFVGKEVVLYGFLAEGLKRGEPALLVTASRSPLEISQALGVVLPQFREYEQMGMVRWIDASGSGATPDASHAVLKSSDDRAGILSSLVQAANAAEGGRSRPFRVGFLGLSAVIAHTDERASFSFLQNFVGILKPRNALAMYALEAGALSEAQVESLLSRMDGALVFRPDKDRLMLSVRGFGEVETREWIECRATQRALIVGSFALERIR